MPRATWFCIDIEASGPVPSLYDMLSLGAVRVAEQADGKFDIGDPYYLEFKPTAPRVDPGAMKVNGLDLDKLRAEGLDLGEGLARLNAWVAAQTPKGSKAVFVGHNAPFDWSFVSWSYGATGVPNPFGWNALDTKALATGVLGIHWLDSNKERLQLMLGLPEQDRSKVHRADYDAWYQALILVRLLERRSTCADSSV